MRYLGSKTLLLEQIYDLIKEYREGIFCDPFGGIGTVGSYMKKKDFHVITGDILNFAHFFQYTLIERSAESNFTKLYQALQINSKEEFEKVMNQSVVNSGWLIKDYSEQRRFFTKDNAKRIQGCINLIQEWYSEELITDNERKVLVASLINSFDKVANTAGTYYGYLKQFDRRALKEFRFAMLPVVRGKTSYSLKTDAIELVSNCKCDVLYLDPPYNERNYARYYHLPETIAAGVVPIPSGKSGVFRLEGEKTSEYNKKNHALEAFKELIDHADAKCIIFHYTDYGLIRIEDARKILSSYGTVEKECYFNSKGYSTSSHERKENKHHIIKVCR